MRIAFISYEYPPETAFGGIATYVQQAARLLQGRGHQVEVFAGCTTRSRVEEDQGVLVHLVQLPQAERHLFGRDIATVIAERHRTEPFDVLEGPEFAAEAKEAVALCPDIPLVVKLHMGMFSIQQIEAATLGVFRKLRRRLGAIRRGERPFWHREHPGHIEEWRHTLNADAIIAPSEAMGDWMQKAWDLPADRIGMVPNPYLPRKELLQIPISSSHKVVTFLGRLELRKGILDLIEAAPAFLTRCPDWRIRVVGRPQGSPVPSMDMREYLLDKLKGFRERVVAEDPVPLNAIPEILANSDICVFPSVWENFPNVCLEAMSAGRGIVASAAGGMSEQLDGGRCGILVPPRNPSRLAKALIHLAENPAMREKLGAAARDRVMTAYNGEVVGPMLEAGYERAIKAYARRKSSLAGQSDYCAASIR